MTQPYTMTSPASTMNGSDGKQPPLDQKSSGISNADQVKGLNDKQKKEVVGWVKDQYERMKSQRLRIRRSWDIALEVYGGKQYVDQIFDGMNPVSRAGTTKSPKHRERSVTNRVRPMIRTEITRQTSQRPSVTCVPASGEDDDLFAASAAESVWEFMYSHYNIQWIMERNAFWTSTCGNGFVKTWWDQQKQDTLFKNVLGAPTVGNVRFGVVTPYNMFVPDLLCEEIEDQPYVFEAYTRPVEWASHFFGGEYQASTAAKTEIFESTYFQTAGNDNTLKDSVLIIEAYIKPGGCKLFKNGGMATLCGDNLVRYQEGMPYSHEEYPYSHTKHVMSGKFYATSVLDDIIPLQRELNRTRSQIIESKNRMARPQLLAPMGSMDIDKYTSEPGLIIPYKPALGKPEPLPLEGLPTYVLQEVDRIISDMEDISGQHQASRGMSPGSGVVAATAIAFLQEKDDAIISSTMSSIEQTIQKVARQALTLAVDFWDIPRIIRVTGTDRSFDSFTLKGSDLANGLDVRVEAGSALPSSKSARQAFLMDLANSGMISPQQMLDMLEIGGVNQLVDRMRIDMRAAQRENLRMKRLTPDMVAQFMVQTMTQALQGEQGSMDPNTGTPTVDPGNLMSYPPVVPVNKWDNHPVHISTHNNYRKSQEFEQLDDVVKDQFERHIHIHETYVFMQTQNPAFGQAQAGVPNSQMGMTPELATGPDASGVPPTGQPPMGGGQPPPQGGQPQPQMTP